jgi:hypothetical protein
MVSSNSVTHEATKFGDSICLVCISTFKCLFIWTQLTQALTDTGGGYHLGALNFKSNHSSSFPSNILRFPLIAPPSLQLCQYLDHLAKPHRTSINRKGPRYWKNQTRNYLLSQGCAIWEIVQEAYVIPATLNNVTQQEL